jgi:hypothetical protein
MDKYFHGHKIIHCCIIMVLLDNRKSVQYEAVRIYFRSMFVDWMRE